MAEDEDSIQLVCMRVEDGPAIVETTTRCGRCGHVYAISPATLRLVKDRGNGVYFVTCTRCFTGTDAEVMISSGQIREAVDYIRAEEVQRTMLTEEQMLDWIDQASYEDLLRKWRFDPPGDGWFVGPIGEHFRRVMNAKRAANPSGAVEASKRIGWEPMGGGVSRPDSDDD
jgi:hypothetical protein